MLRWHTHVPYCYSKSWANPNRHVFLFHIYIYRCHPWNAERWHTHMFHVRGSMSISILRLYAYVRRYKKVPHPISTRTQHPRLFCSCAYIQKSAPSYLYAYPTSSDGFSLKAPLNRRRASKKKNIWYMCVDTKECPILISTRTQHPRTASPWRRPWLGGEPPRGRIHRSRGRWRRRHRPTPSQRLASYSSP